MTNSLAQRELSVELVLYVCARSVLVRINVPQDDPCYQPLFGARTLLFHDRFEAGRGGSHFGDSMTPKL